MEKTNSKITIESKIIHLENTFYKERVKLFADVIKHNGFISAEQWEELTGKKVYSSPSIHMIKRAARHYHIAASLLRGTQYEDIECPRVNNRPDMKLVLSLVEAAHDKIAIEEQKMREEEAQ